MKRGAAGPGMAGVCPYARVPHVNIYWFAWADFYPETTVFAPQKGDTP